MDIDCNVLKVDSNRTGAQRNSSVEILRIIAMILIVVSHYTTHGGIDKAALLGSGHLFNTWLLQFANVGNLGVDIFVLIFGYFTVKSTFRVEKVVKLLLQVWLYSAVIYVVFVLTGLTDFSVMNFAKSLLPTIFEEYWFFTAYIVLFLFTPFLNRALNATSKTGFFKLLLLTVGLWCIVPTFTTRHLYGSEIPTFLMLYLIGAYIRLYPDCKLNSIKVGIPMTVAGIVLMALSSVVFDLIAGYSAIFFENATFFYSRTSVLTIATAVGLLVVFINIKPFHSKFVNEIAACTFGVYLIHDNNYVRSFLWQDVFHNTEYAASDYLIIHMLIAVVTVFTACTVIEWFRRHILEKHYMNAVVSVISLIERSSWLSKIMNLLN